MKKFSQEEIEVYLKVLDFSKIEGGLLPVVVQDIKTNQILMLAFSNEEAIRKTLETGYAYFYSRSRKMLWKKGETSGHVQEVEQVITDCDSDSLLLKVKQKGAACHKGYYTCFYNEFDQGDLKIISKKVFDPKEVYKK